MQVTDEFALTPIPLVDTNGKVTKIREIPYILLKFHSKMSHKTTKFAYRCLIDSGSDMLLFPSDIAISLGLNYERGKLKWAFGIGGVKIPTYLHNDIEFILPKGKHFSTSIQFSERQKVPLLGRNGFFDRFTEVIFDMSNSSFRLIYEK